MESLSDEQDLSRSFTEHEKCGLRSLVEAALFASPEPVKIRELARALRETEDGVEHLLAQIMAEFAQPEHGVFVRKVRGGYQMGTKPEHHEGLKELLRGLRPQAPLSGPALQTLAIIAYKQPVAASEIQAIRRVEGAGVLSTLLKRKLIAPAGRKNDGGNALLYRTTDLFLKDFGLQNLRELPALKEFAPLRQPSSDALET